METVGILVVGGGQAGLAVGWHLRRRGLVPGRDFRIVDDAPQPGGAWCRMWPGMRLISSAPHSCLPGMAMPPWRGEGNPDAAHVAGYLADYEDRHQLAVDRGVRVTGVSKGEPLRIETTAGDLGARSVVNATGTWSRPFVPGWPGRDRFPGQQLHSVHYRGPAAFAGQRVAVVGGGNSAAQILAEVAPVAADCRWVTRRPPAFLPEDVDGEALFQLASARRRASHKGALPGPSTDDLSDIVMVPSVQRARQRHQLVAHRPFTRFEGSDLVWEQQGVRWHADAVVWASGCRPALRHLRGTGLLRPDGRPEAADGVSSRDPRFHFVGYGDWVGRSSATLVGVGPYADAAVQRLLPH